MEREQRCNLLICANTKVTLILLKYIHYNFGFEFCILIGEHPRIGAMDVCPFIPVKNVTMEECVECAKEFAERLALELDVPGNNITFCFW